MRVNVNESAWQRALDRAVAEELRLRRLHMPPEFEQGGMQSYLVEGSNHNGSWYLVELHQNSVSVVVVCSCLAGQKRMPCKHGAAVLAHAGLLPMYRSHAEVA